MKVNLATVGTILANLFQAALIGIDAYKNPADMAADVAAGAAPLLNLAATVSSGGQAKSFNEDAAIAATLSPEVTALINNFANVIHPAATTPASAPTPATGTSSAT